MEAYIFFKDKEDRNKVFRARPPFLVATIVDAYELEAGLSSNIVDGKKVVLDTCYSNAIDSKIRWALNQALKQYLNNNTKQ